MSLDKKDIFPSPKIISNKGKISFAVLIIAMSIFVGITLGPKIIAAIEQPNGQKSLDKDDADNHPVQNPDESQWQTEPDMVNEDVIPKQVASQSQVIVPSVSQNIGNQDIASINAQNDAMQKEQVQKALSSNISPAVNQQLQLQNLERQKEDSEDYLDATKKAPKSPYEVQAGSMIPATLQTGLNSDLPGYATGLVRENVYDSVTGRFLLIPKGTRIFGKYDSRIAYGQKRLFIAWDRLLFPDGSSIDIKGMGGTDKQGMSGFSDSVDNHFGSLLAGVILSSVIGAGAQLSQPQNSSGLSPSQSQTVGQTLAGQAGMQVSNAASQIIQKNLNVQPTIVIRPGYEFNIMVNKDMILPPVNN